VRRSSSTRETRVPGNSAHALVPPPPSFQKAAGRPLRVPCGGRLTSAMRSDSRSWVIGGRASIGRPEVLGGLPCRRRNQRDRRKERNDGPDAGPTPPHDSLHGSRGPDGSRAARHRGSGPLDQPPRPDGGPHPASAPSRGSLRSRTTMSARAGGEKLQGVRPGSGVQSQT